MGQGVKPQLLFRSNINVSNSLAPCTENCHKLESSIVWLIVNLYITASFQWSTFPTIPCPELHIYLKNKYAINFFIIVCHVLKLCSVLYPAAAMDKFLCGEWELRLFWYFIHMYSHTDNIRSPDVNASVSRQTEWVLTDENTQQWYKYN